MPLSLLHSKIAAAQEDVYYALGVFLDLPKHLTLLTMKYSSANCIIKHYGVRGITLQWFRSYLSNRIQCVSYKDHDSYSSLISHDVSQGSILSPLMFLVYINDLHLSSNEVEFLIFADDTNIFRSDRDIVEHFSSMNNELNNILLELMQLSFLLTLTKPLIYYFIHQEKKFILTISPFAFVNVLSTELTLVNS